MTETKAHLLSGRAVPHCLLALAALALGACSNGTNPEVDPNASSAVTQDLTIDPEGNTVVADLTGLNGSVFFSSVEVSGTQTLLDIQYDGTNVILEFDTRVTPGDQIRILDVSGVDDAWRDVTTSDARTPEMVVVAATQDTSDTVLGGDTITAAFVSGPRIVQSQVEDLSSWSLTVDGIPLDLTGSAVAWNEGTQVATVTLGSQANLHASFSVAVDVETVAATPLSTAPITGAATGDSVAPALEGGSPVVQVLDPLASGDEYGRSLSFDFDEPISPVFGAKPSNFEVVDHLDAIGTTSITRVAVDAADNTILRVTFSRPVVPGLDQITLDGIVDAHGNPMPVSTSPITAGSTVANAFTGVTFETLEGVDNDVITAVMTQALDPDTAALASRWTLALGGVNEPLTDPMLSYDMLARTLTIELGADSVNGTTADLVAVGGMDIDGEAFSVAAVQVMASGDLAAPSVVDTTQNRGSDPSGMTIDVRFSEDVEVTAATTTTNYTFDPVIAINGATIINGSTVRLELASAAVPGDVTIAIAQAITDPAGNDLGAAYGPAPLSSTDVTAPLALGANSSAIEGPENDEIVVLFNDLMIPAEVENIANWMFESPVGMAVDISAGTVSYNSVTSVATVSLDAVTSPSLRLDQDFELTFASMRDLGGNTVEATPVGGIVDGERTTPVLESAFIVAGGAGDEMVLRFSEAMGRIDDLYDAATNPTGVRFELIDPMTSAITYPTTATALDAGLGVELVFAAMIDPLATMDIVGLTDLAGNGLFPVIGTPLDVEDVTAPEQFAAPALVAVEGVDNDTVQVAFNVPMASWRILSPENYTLTETVSMNSIDLSGSTFTFDGNQTLTIDLDDAASGEFDASLTYDFALVVDPANPLRSRQGVEIVAPNSELAVAVGGDNTNGPTQGASVAILDPSNPNGLFVVFDESVDTAAATTAADYNYNFGSIATSAVMLTDRAVLVEFGGPVAVAGQLEIAVTAAVDSAGNAASGSISLVVVEDLAAPAVDDVTASIVSGFGSDLVAVQFTEDLDPDSAVNILNYTVTDASGELRIGGAAYDSQSTTVMLFVEDLDDGATVSVLIDGVTDLAGNLPVAPLSDSAVASGDAFAPDLTSAYVNTFDDASGLTIEVIFSESVDTSFASVASNWSTSGSAAVAAAEVISATRVRLQLNLPMDPTDTLTLAAGLTDAAGNEQGQQTIDPVE